MDALSMMIKLRVIINLVLNHTLELLHYHHKPDMFVSEMINCGVYLMSTEIFNLDVYKDYGEKYGRILEISRDDSKEKSLSKL
jgi:hypothetical protein